jgi:hypothetical protein
MTLPRRLALRGLLRGRLVLRCGRAAGIALCALAIGAGSALRRRLRLRRRTQAEEIPQDLCRLLRLARRRRALWRLLAG